MVCTNPVRPCELIPCCQLGVRFPEWAPPACEDINGISRSARTWCSTGNRLWEWMSKSERILDTPSHPSIPSPFKLLDHPPTKPEFPPLFLRRFRNCAHECLRSLLCARGEAAEQPLPIRAREGRRAFRTEHPPKEGSQTH